MGLAAPKNRFKISKDPNNTTWSNNTTRFGHRLLTSQGWTPGSTLGASNASHSSHYTDASTSHIRILLKDDTLGLGAKKGSDKAENFGLAGLDSVLARLNGKDEGEVREIEKKEEERHLRVYAGHRWGFMNFVSGGHFVGDKIERVKPVGECKEVVAVKEEKKRKRNVEEAENEDLVGAGEEQPRLKRKRRSQDLKAAAKKDAIFESEATAEEIEEKPKKERKEKGKKDKKDKKRRKDVDSDVAAIPVLSEKEQRKAEKRARKEDRRLRKEQRRAKKEKEKQKASSSTSDEASSTDEVQTGASTPSTTTQSASAATAFRGRNAVRQRYLRQRAAMDPSALKEIFMVKTPA